MLPAERHDVLVRHRATRAEHDGGVHCLTPVLRRNPDPRCLVNTGMLFKRSLDLRRIYIHSAGDDHVILSITDIDIALSIAIRDIPDRMEVPAPRRIVALLLLVVLVEDHRGPHE